MPRLVMVGLSHHATPLEVRERVAIDLDNTVWRRCAPGGLATLLLSTCNRLEVYAWVEGRPAVAVRSADGQPCLKGSLAGVAEMRQAFFVALPSYL